MEKTVQKRVERRGRWTLRDLNPGPSPNLCQVMGGSSRFFVKTMRGMVWSVPQSVTGGGARGTFCQAELRARTSTILILLGIFLSNEYVFPGFEFWGGVPYIKFRPNFVDADSPTG